MFPRKLRRWWHGGNTLTVFCFHSVVAEPLPTPDPCFIPRTTFEKQLAGIAAEFDIQRLETALDLLWKGSLRQPAAALTFDDGFRSHYEVVLPILRRMGFPATLFLCTGTVAPSEPLWFSRLHRAICLTQRESVDWRGASLSLAPENRASTSSLLQGDVRKLDPDSVEGTVESLCRQLEVDEPRRDDPSFGALDPATITAMVREGTFRFGAHTRNHHVLSRLSPARQREEIVGSVTDVARLTGRSPALFAYPGGGPADFTSHADRILDELGLDAAFSMLEAPCTRQDTRFRLPRCVLGSREL